MKDLGFTASVLKNSNKVVSSTATHWGAVRNGALFSIGSDMVFYQVEESRLINFTKDFKTISTSELLFNSNLCPWFLVGDDIEISVKEFCVSDVVGIFSGGVSYKVGDEVTLCGGTPILDISQNKLTPALFLVTSVNENGSIQDVTVLNPGHYAAIPNVTTMVSGGSGKSGGLNLNYRTSEKRIIYERMVGDVIYHPEQTIVVLDYPLPDYVSAGVLKMEKWEILLTSNYVGDSKLDSAYKVYRDFTPNLGLPIILKNSQNQEALINKSFQILDSEIAKIKKGLSGIGINV